MKFTLARVTAVASVFLIMSGCGSDNNTAATGNSNLTGRLVDSPVSGVSYSTDSLSGLTNSDGQFEYKDGETVSFTIGGIALGSNDAQSTITPLDLLNTNDVNDDAVVNMLRLLQTLDDNGDPSDGISITSAVRTNAEAVTIDFNQTVTDFENDASVTTITQAPLVSASDAISHFNTTLSDIGHVDGIVGVWNMNGIPNGETLTFMFTEGGDFIHIETGNSDPTGSDGIEIGTYTWNSETGALSITITTDTNGEWGFSDSADFTFTVNGDTATMTTSDSNDTLTRVSGSGAAIHGGWEGINYVEGRHIFFVYYPDGKTVHAEAGAADFSGSSGLEVTTYTWNASNGELNVTTPSVDTNGEWGYSHSSGFTFTVNGDDVTFSASDGSVSLKRIF